MGALLSLFTILGTIIGVYIDACTERNNRLTKALEDNKKLREDLIKTKRDIDIKCLELDAEINKLKKENLELEKKGTQFQKKIADNLKKLRDLRAQRDSLPELFGPLYQMEQQGKNIRNMPQYTKLKFTIRNLLSKAAGIGLSIGFLAWSIISYLNSCKDLENKVKELENKVQNEPDSCPSPSTTSVQSFRSVLQKFYSPDTL